jgi:hypothetical protein
VSTRKEESLACNVSLLKKMCYIVENADFQRGADVDMDCKDYAYY